MNPIMRRQTETETITDGFITDLIYCWFNWSSAPPPHLGPALPVLQQQVEQTRCQLVVGDALTKTAVIILLQPPVQHHLQLTCRGQR